MIQNIRFDLLYTVFLTFSALLLFGEGREGRPTIHAINEEPQQLFTVGNKIINV